MNKLKQAIIGSLMSVAVVIVFGAKTFAGAACVAGGAAGGAAGFAKDTIECLGVIFGGNCNLDSTRGGAQAGCEAADKLAGKALEFAEKVGGVAWDVAKAIGEGVFNQFAAQWNDTIGRLFPGLTIPPIGTHKHANNVFESNMTNSQPSSYNPLKFTYFKKFGDVFFTTWLITSDNPDDKFRYGLEDGIGGPYASFDDENNVCTRITVDFNPSVFNVYVTGSATVGAGTASYGGVIVIENVNNSQYFHPNVIREGDSGAMQTVIATGTYSDAPTPLRIEMSPNQKFAEIKPWTPTVDKVNIGSHIQYSNKLVQGVKEFFFEDKITNTDNCLRFTRRATPFNVNAQTYAYTPSQNKPENTKFSKQGQEMKVGDEQIPGLSAWPNTQGDIGHDGELFIPGQDITFYSDLRATDADIPYHDGWNNMKATVKWGTYGWNDDPFATLTGDERALPLADSLTQNGDIKQDHIFYYGYHNYKIQPGDANRKICEWVEYSPLSGTSSEGYNATGHSKPSCVYVKYHYPNTVSASTNQNATVEQDGVVKIGATISNTGTLGDNLKPTNTKKIPYQIKAFISDTDHSSDGVKDISSFDCRDAVGADCIGGDASGDSESVVSGGSYQITGDRRLTIDLSKVENSVAGKYLCSFIMLDNQWSVDNGLDSSVKYRSPIKCSKIGKKPQMHIMGGDVYGDGFQGSNRGVDGSGNASSGNAKRGSIAQYGLMSNANQIMNFGSDGYSNVKNQPQSQLLWFASKDSDSNYGKPGGVETNVSVPNIKTDSTSDTLADGKINVNGIYKTTTDLSLPMLNYTTTATVYSEGDITISGNISSALNDSNRSLYTQPALTIIAKGNIYIKNSVVRIDANLVAGGKIVTCKVYNKDTNGNDELKVDGACDNQLHIRGSLVSVDKPSFQRTFGAGKNAKDGGRNDPNRDFAPAEWIDFSPLQWLKPKYIPSAEEQAKHPNQIEASSYLTSTVTELPARL